MSINTHRLYTNIGTAGLDMYDSKKFQSKQIGGCRTLSTSSRYMLMSKNMIGRWFSQSY